MKKIFLLLLATLAIQEYSFSAEAGMPQLDPKYWASQAFWLTLIFIFLYLGISKVFIPKIKNNLDNRDDKIKNDLDDAKNLKKLAEEKQKKYEISIDNAKKEVKKIIFENNSNLNLEILNKKKLFEKEIMNEINKIQKEIKTLKEKSIKDIAIISEQLTSNIIERISGDKLNESSIKAAVSEISKNKVDKYL